MSVRPDLIRGDKPLWRLLRAIAYRQITDSIVRDSAREICLEDARRALRFRSVRDTLDPREVWGAWEAARFFAERHVAEKMKLIEQRRLSDALVAVRLSPLGWDVVGSPEQMQAVALLGGEP